MKCLDVACMVASGMQFAARGLLAKIGNDAVVRHIPLGIPGHALDTTWLTSAT